MNQFKIICVIGTRPEALKMAPVIEKLSANSLFEVKTVLSAQHRELLDQVLQYFAIKPDADFDVMTENQGLAELSSKLLLKFNDYFAKEKPDLVIGQGDTSTTMISALAAFYHKIPFAHVEAGLRTSDINSPFPEELNRRIAGRIATLHFPPTQVAKDNLAKEGITENVFTAGNTVIDTLLFFANQLETKTDQTKKIILTTCHRRENFGKPLENICAALKTIALKHDDVEIVFPVHPNPNVKNIVYKALQGIENIKLVEPFDYPKLVETLKSCYLVLTDSGGLQEEAPALAKPVLVLREETERPEGVLCGVSKIVGTDTTEIVNNVNLLLNDKNHYTQMIGAGSPYGDGFAAERISHHIECFLLNKPPSEEGEKATNIPREFSFDFVKTNKETAID